MKKSAGWIRGPYEANRITFCTQASHGAAGGEVVIDFGDGRSISVAAEKALELLKVLDRVALWDVADVDVFMSSEPLPGAVQIQAGLYIVAFRRAV